MKKYEEPSMRIIRLHNEDVVATYDGPINGTAPNNCPDPDKCTPFPNGFANITDPTVPTV